MYIGICLCGNVKRKYNFSSKCLNQIDNNHTLEARNSYETEIQN